MEQDQYPGRDRDTELEAPDATLMDSAPSAAPRAAGFYRDVLERLGRADIPFVVGGAWAFALYTGIERPTKDLDLFVRRCDFERIARVAAEAGWGAELSHPHWLAKIWQGDEFVDLVFRSANGLAEVDQGWFEHALPAEVLGVPVLIAPVEETIQSKSFVMERERYDGADVAHLLHARGQALDWARLLERMGPHWRVLLAHLVLFGYIYPSERDRVPDWVMDRLLAQLRQEMLVAPPPGAPCRGTLLSRAQYLHDVGREGYDDGREAPHGALSADEIAAWTEAIDQDGRDAPPAHQSR